ncbi:matrixin family metalloprotease [Streptomyces sp. NPDC056486]|uniref:matrixin family metalloprotease n=1 Tax=Streptomyces sp. NPDC056486 TaxID=3345835 RepID=UPI0036B9275B
MFALILSATTISVGPQVMAAERCVLPEGELSISELPSGSSAIECDAIGRMVAYGNTGVTVPQPGMTVEVDSLTVSGEIDGFALSVSKDGIVSYGLGEENTESTVGGSDVPDDLSGTVTTPGDKTEESDSDGADESDIPQEGDVPVLTEDDFHTTALSACWDGAYKHKGWAEYGTYNWYIGDGGMPGALSRTQAMWAFTESIHNIVNPNVCGYNDGVDAWSKYKGTTTYEADINTSGKCTDRDGKSTWDAGNLPSGTLAVTCSFSASLPPGMKDDLTEADVRFNTQDYNFTNNPTSSCRNKFDIRSVGTHEAGHAFGLGHVTGRDHENLTMQPYVGSCETQSRSLGKGDILGLKKIYTDIH